MVLKPSQNMEASELRKKFLEFFEKRGHRIIPSSSLIPDDPSVLLTTAGMQQFKPYLTGKSDSQATFGSNQVISLQKCFRTTDIDEVGDDTHNTFFEMLGNFSFGGYFKKEAIALSFEFITSPEGVGLDPQKLFVTAFKGDGAVLRDSEVIALWQEQFKKVGIDAKIGERIFLYGREKNWWEAGLGPAGSDAEMFFDREIPHDQKFGPACHPNCDCGRFVEIGNDVFVQYNKIAEGKYEPLLQKSVDNGRGFERLVMVVQGKSNIFETDLFAPFIALLPSEITERHKRIIADHLRGIAFLLADGIRPSNKEAGYILRRLMRRVFVYEHIYKTPVHIFDAILHDLAHEYGEFYKELLLENEHIREEFSQEREKFSKTLARGMKELRGTENAIMGENAFRLYETFGLPYEIIKELGEDRARNLTRAEFDKEFKKHQEISRAGAEKKFGGHGLLLDTGELKAADERELKIVTRLHTATHLLQAALRKILGSEAHQQGSDITVLRTRFDFTFSRKITSEEIKQVENLVNEAIRRDFLVAFEDMDYEDAIRSGALQILREKYPERVKVYTIFDSKTGEVFSREFCGGPHVEHTGEIGHVRIIKEEASSAGVRRIRAAIDPHT